MSDWNEYDEFIAEADRDTREGHQEAVIGAIEDRTWPDGTPYRNITFNLVTSNMSKVFMSLNHKPTPEACAVEKAKVKAGGPRNIMQSMAATLALYKQLEQYYGVTGAEQLKVGDVFEVECVKDKPRKKDGKRYLKIRAFLPKGSVNKADEQPASSVPF